MKKIIAAAAGLMLVGSAMVTTASAVENKFGGYWRTRMYTQIDMDGQDSGTYSVVDTRTRLYYTAIFNENFKFVNKFEFDATWGEPKGSGYGDIGADGTVFEIKNSYADFNMGMSNWKVGVQGFQIARGFMVDDDAPGIIATFDLGAVVLPFAWLKANDSDKYPTQNERDYYTVMPVIKAGEGVSIQPLFTYDKNQGAWDNMYLGVNVDAKMDVASFWGTAIYNFGTIDATVPGASDTDISAYLLAFGATTGPVHGQIFYASGDDNAADNDMEGFINPTGASYYWSEIMGYGIFDNTVSGGSPGDQISNIWAANVGFTVKPMEKLSLGADVWYAELAESATDTDLGLEFDVKATYAIMDNLKLDLVAAYLIAGDATGDEDPIEVGARLSLSF